MTASPRQPITVRRLAATTVYALPRRPLGGLGFVAGFMILFGASFAAGPLVTALTSAAGSSSPGGFDWFFLAVSLPFVAAGLLAAVVGLAILFGNTEIELRRDRIAAVERLGPLRWRRGRRARLRRITVMRAVVRANGRVVRKGRLAGMAGMSAGFDDARELVLAVGYPEPWLLDLAERLRRDHELEQPAELLHDDTVEVVRREPGDDAGGNEEVPRPAQSMVQLHQNADGVTLVIPPAGLMKGSKGLFAFGIIWCLFTTVIIGGLIAAPRASGDVWALLLFGVVFLAVGAGLVVAGVNMGRRHAIIDVVDDVLLINRSNIFGLKSHQWTAAEIERIAVGPSGMEVNEKPVMELQVRPAAGRTVGMFAGRDDAELRWMAWVLRRAVSRKGSSPGLGREASSAARLPLALSPPSSRSPSGNR